MLVMCFSTAAWLTKSDSAIPRFDFPSAIAASTSRSRGLSRSRGRILAAAAEHPRDHLGVERGAAGGDPVDRVDEDLQLPHTLLEQVPDALGVLGDQLLRVVLLVILREHEDSNVGLLALELERGAQPVVLVVRRHPDVDHRDIGAVGERPAEEVVGIVGLRDHIQTSLRQQASDTLAHQHVVLADHDAQRFRHTGKATPLMVPGE